MTLNIDYLRFVDGTLNQWCGIQDEAAFRILAEVVTPEILTDTGENE